MQPVISDPARANVARRLVASIGFLLLSCVQGCASYDAGAPEGVDLSGHWVLDPQASDDVRKVIAEVLGDDRPPRPAAGRSPVPPEPETEEERKARERRIEALRARHAREIQDLREQLLASDRLDIEQQGPDLTLTTEFTSRSVRAGSKLQTSVPGGGLADATAGWDGRTFVVNRSVPGGPRLVEQYRLINNGTQLEATLAISGRGPLAGVRLRRVYDRSDAPPLRRPMDVPQR